MKKLFTVFIIGIIFITSLSFLGIDAMAYLPPTPFEDFSYDSNGKYIGERYTEIWHTENVENDFTLKSSQYLRIANIYDPTVGKLVKLVIKNGAKAVIKGDLFIERGGILEIEDGTVIINGGNITNCGTIKIGKKGMLKIIRGTLNSTAAGSIQNDGIITCLKANKNLKGCFKSIEKYDENFNLSDYSLSINSDGKSVTVTANYCIDDIMTDYKYKFDISTDSKKIKVTHTGYKLQNVYDSETVEKLRKRVSSFESKNRKYLVYKIYERNSYYWKDCGYTYDFKTDELIYTAKWFTYDDKNTKFIENNFSGKV